MDQVRPVEARLDHEAVDVQFVHRAPEGLVGSCGTLYNNTHIWYMAEHMPHLETRRGRVCRCRVLQVSL